jgi:hypothetical protein
VRIRTFVPTCNAHDITLNAVELVAPRETLQSGEGGGSWAWGKGHVPQTQHLGCHVYA